MVGVRVESAFDETHGPGEEISRRFGTAHDGDFMPRRQQVLDDEAAHKAGSAGNQRRFPVHSRATGF